MTSDLETERITLIAEMENSIDPAVLNVLELMRDEEHEQAVSLELRGSEGTLYAGTN